jgi:hypothetical protein
MYIYTQLSVIHSHSFTWSCIFNVTFMTIMLSISDYHPHGSCDFECKSMTISLCCHFSSMSWLISLSHPCFVLFCFVLLSSIDWFWFIHSINKFLFEMGWLFLFLVRGMMEHAAQNSSWLEKWVCKWWMGPHCWQSVLTLSLSLSLHTLSI